MFTITCALNKGDWRSRGGNHKIKLPNMGLHTFQRKCKVKGAQRHVRSYSCISYKFACVDKRAQEKLSPKQAPKITKKMDAVPKLIVDATKMLHNNYMRHIPCITH